jgi:hypothetical protein
MAAGQGFKTFATGEVLTAGDVNGYLMQGVLVFASAAARDAAITSPQEGQFAFTKDTNGLWYYDGAAWVASGATGDIEGVTAGVGISGGGTSGTVTVTNSMATAITTAGDLIKGTGSGTFDRLGIGSTGQVLTVAAGTASWATPSSSVPTGIFTLLNSGGTSLSGSATVSISGLSGYNTLKILVQGASQNGGGEYSFRINSSSAASNYSSNGTYVENATTYSVALLGISNQAIDAATSIKLGYNSATAGVLSGMITIDAANSTGVKPYSVLTGVDATNGNARYFTNGIYTGTSVVSSVHILTSAAAFDAGTVYVYGGNL